MTATRCGLPFVGGGREMVAAVVVVVVVVVVGSVNSSWCGVASGKGRNGARRATAPAIEGVS